MSQSLRDGAGNYLINGKRYPSVTTILGKMCKKERLNIWKKQHDDWPTISRHAQIYGTFMHMQIQEAISGEIQEIPSNMPFNEWPKDLAEELEGRMEQWNKLGLRFGKPCLVEHTVVIKAANSAGTLDHFGPIDEIDMVMDLKSSAKPQKSHEIQLGAYYLGLLVEGRHAKQGMIPYVHRDSIEIVELMEEELMDRGQKFVEIAKRFYKQGKPNQ
jgi:CRISPR/Cas system-associated exonuclease Cas4 (RecB family)